MQSYYLLYKYSSEYYECSALIKTWFIVFNIILYCITIAVDWYSSLLDNDDYPDSIPVINHLAPCARSLNFSLNDETIARSRRAR